MVSLRHCLSVALELTRFGGRFTLWGKGVHDAKDTSAIPACVPRANRRVGSVGPYARRAGKELEPSARAIRNGACQADLDEGKRKDGVTTTEQEELRRLRRENEQLRQEREILAKAAAWLARETGSVPDTSSSS